MLETGRERMLFLRKEVLNLSQEQLSEQLRVHYTYISQLERGKNEPSDMFLAFLAHTFCISETWLRTGEGPMRTDHDLNQWDFRCRQAIKEGKAGQNIGERIRFLRTWAGQDLLGLSAHLKISKEYLAGIERGSKELTGRLLEDIRSYFDVTESWLLTGEGPFRESGDDAAPFSVNETMAAEEYKNELIIRQHREKEIRDTFLAVINGGKSEIDEELEAILSAIRLFWVKASPDLRTWFKVQFGIEFPQIEELKKSLTEPSASMEA